MSCRCPDALVAAVDEVRGAVPRERWLRDAVTLAVDLARGSGVDESRLGAEPARVGTVRVPPAPVASVAVGAIVEVPPLGPVQVGRTGLCEHRVPATSYCRYCD